jgi:predicted acyl esterase
VVKIWTAAAAVLAVALLAASPAATAGSTQNVTILSADGTALAATLYVPGGSPPAGGWPAVVFLHGLAAQRSSMVALATAMGMIGDDYVVLAYDARGHGQSGGLIGIDGPNEVADARAAFEWLRDRPDVADSKIGAWGISYGGGGALNSLVAGVPWATVEVAETWTDLYAALMPQGLAKSGVIGGFITALPAAKIDPTVVAATTAAYAGRGEEVAGFAAQRSSLAKLRGVRTPIFFMQGRRDFAFGIDQATRAYAMLSGPKRLWIGNHGHQPSTFPAADTGAMLGEGKQWFDRFLRDVPNGIDRSASIVIASAGSARVTRSTRLPRLKTVTFRFAPARKASITQKGRVVFRTAPTTTALEVFGSPQVRVDTRATGGWSRLVAVLSARTPSGKEIVVSGGGVPLATGRRAVTIRLLDQATYVPKGSRLTVTLASSSLAQSSGNLVYLDLPMPGSARATIGTTGLLVPVLRTPVSR